MSKYKYTDKELSMKAALEDIHNISIGYDGYGTVKSLKKLIDELKDITKQGLLGHYHENRDSKPSLSPAKDVRGKVAPEDSSQWKCNWINCLHGCGLSGNGRCSADGEWNNMSCGKFTKIPKHLYDKPSPEPSMPLIEVNNPYGGAGNLYITKLIKERITQQRDADMAWYLEKVQQMRKAFAAWLKEECNQHKQYSGTSPEPCSYYLQRINCPECQTHLRAMAGGER